MFVVMKFVGVPAERLAVLEKVIAGTHYWDPKSLSVTVSGSWPTSTFAKIIESKRNGFDGYVVTIEFKFVDVDRENPSLNAYPTIEMLVEIFKSICQMQTTSEVITLSPKEGKKLNLPDLTTKQFEEAFPGRQERPTKA